MRELLPELGDGGLESGVSWRVSKPAGTSRRSATLRTDDTTITPLHEPGTVFDPLTEIAREGSRHMLMAEAAGFVAQSAEGPPPDGRQRVVPHDAGPEPAVRTGIGAIPVRRPKSLPRT